MNIEFRNVSFKYSDEEVLNNVSFKISSNTSTALIGPNGSGKSTIVKLMMGLLKCDSGNILLDGIDVSSKEFDNIRHKLGIIFQNPDNQFVGVTVKDDIAFGLENRRIERSEMLKRIDKYAKLVHVEKFLNESPENLSGGQKQRVAIAGVLALEPDVLVFDEATSMLDPISVKEVIETLKMLKFEAKKQIITITHNLEEIIYFDQVILLNNGKVVKIEKPIELLKDIKLMEENNLVVPDFIKLVNEVKNEQIKNKLWELIYKM